MCVADEHSAAAAMTASKAAIVLEWTTHLTSVLPTVQHFDGPNVSLIDKVHCLSVVRAS